MTKTLHDLPSHGSPEEGLLILRHLCKSAFNKQLEDIPWPSVNQLIPQLDVFFPEKYDLVAVKNLVKEAKKLRF